jgi:hypothetical protein
VKANRIQLTQLSNGTNAMNPTPMVMEIKGSTRSIQQQCPGTFSQEGLDSSSVPTEVGSSLEIRLICRAPSLCVEAEVLWNKSHKHMAFRWNWGKAQKGPLIKPGVTRDRNEMNPKGNHYSRHFTGSSVSSK